MSANLPPVKGFTKAIVVRDREIADLRRVIAAQAAEADALRAALLDTARRVEALKRPCGMDPESAQAIRNGEYMGIALAARAALKEQT